MSVSADAVLDLISSSSDTWLLLDYDGTLKDFEPTPGIIRPDPVLAQLLADLVACPGVNVAIISGRRLADLLALLPVPGLWLAGTYGLEWFTPDGKKILPENASALLLSIKKVKKAWTGIIGEKAPFYLEDKGLALAIHAKDVEDRLADEVLAAARLSFDTMTGLKASLRMNAGSKFLEVAPLLADKGRAVSWFFEKKPLGGGLLVYLGDDDHDEAAFPVVHALGGIAIKSCRSVKAFCSRLPLGESCSGSQVVGTNYADKA